MSRRRVLDIDGTKRTRSLASVLAVQHNDFTVQFDDPIYGKDAARVYKEQITHINVSTPQETFFDNSQGAMLYCINNGAKGASRHIIGFLAARPLPAKLVSNRGDEANVIEIGLIYVDSRHRGHRYADQLLEKLINDSNTNKTIHYLAVYMQTCVQDIAMLRRYQSRNFAMVTGLFAHIKDVSTYEDIENAINDLLLGKKGTCGAFKLMLATNPPVATAKAGKAHAKVMQPDAGLIALLQARAAQRQKF